MTKRHQKLSLHRHTLLRLDPKELAHEELGKVGAAGPHTSCIPPGDCCGEIVAF